MLRLDMPILGEHNPRVAALIFHQGAEGNAVRLHRCSYALLLLCATTAIALHGQTFTTHCTASTARTVRCPKRGSCRPPTGTYTGRRGLAGPTAMERSSKSPLAARWPLCTASARKTVARTANIPTRCWSRPSTGTFTEQRTLAGPTALGQSS